MKIQRLKFIGILLTLVGNLVVLDGCGAKDNKINDSEAIHSSVDENVDSIDLPIFDKKYIELLDALPKEEDKSLYFVKGEYGNVTLDDIFVNLTDRGIIIDENQKQLYDDLYLNLESYNNEIEGDVDYIISSMKINLSFEEAFLSEAATKVITSHHDLSLYDNKNNKIYWEKLFNVVKDNNQNYLNSDEDAWLKEYYLYEEYSDEEINIVISFLQDYFNNLMQNYPDYDIKTFACHLTELKLFHFKPKTDRLLETWTSGIISSSKYSDNVYLNVALLKTFFDHEFSHFATTNCEDGRALNPCILSTGLNFNDKFSCFSWRFLEEAIAHQYAQELNDETLPFYEINCYILDTINFINQISDGNNSILDASLMQNPIYLIQQFNNPYELEEQEREWLYKNLEMLSCYNLLITNYLVLFEDKVNIESDNLIYGLEENANLQLFRLAISSLSLKRELSLEDNLFFLKLIEKRIEEQDSYLKSYYNLKIKHSANYNDYYQDILNSYFIYLEKTYCLENVSDIYQSFDYESSELNKKYAELFKELPYVKQDDKYMLSIMKPYIK